MVPTFRFATAATSLVIAENGTVAGVYAQDESGQVLQVNAKAVILASGGIGANTELLPEAGMPQDALDDMIVMCVPTVSGDGFTMARAAGCKSYLPQCFYSVVLRHRGLSHGHRAALQHLKLR